MIRIFILKYYVKYLIIRAIHIICGGFIRVLIKEVLGCGDASCLHEVRFWVEFIFFFFCGKVFTKKKITVVWLLMRVFIKNYKITLIINFLKVMLWKECNKIIEKVKNILKILIFWKSFSTSTFKSLKFEFN